MRRAGQCQCGPPPASEGRAGATAPCRANAAAGPPAGPRPLPGRRSRRGRSSNATNAGPPPARWP
eukprot:2372781-Lingulodinium_polyedra.AAC.1